ncbi:hypothetical protein [Desulfosporosinus nitroreducens]|uniref:Uncharacterized protein n=1 Tax=Desulfosporosinus nitroreducens TaxID=2018668 RepID=A0ABT8QU31_9FIRM|nr:hypothetical protein [Desulfosporosinus nitroreducens]MCO1602391.1 hypothetical protein [Desulfosporosinus nitroreducens]MDO0824665.1 hypothetical protein [Desulfosporosinus nitroreducens]
MSLVILGFTLHSILHLETATIALSGAMLLIWAREEPEEVLLASVFTGVIIFKGGKGGN